jgi:hypothetical protein
MTLFAAIAEFFVVYAAILMAELSITVGTECLRRLRRAAQPARRSGG